MFRAVILLFLALFLHADVHEYELYGTVEALPEGGRTGEWTVSGRRVVCDEKTIFIERFGRLETGALVEVKGFEKEGLLYALVLKSRTTKHDNEREFGKKVKFMGVINEQKGDLWLVSGRNVEVRAQTDLPETPLKTGERVRVIGFIDREWVIATRIESQ